MRIYCTDGATDFEGTVADDADLDSTFTLISDDDGQSYRINGWMVSECTVLDEEEGDTGVNAMAERVAAALRTKA